MATVTGTKTDCGTSRVFVFTWTPLTTTNADGNSLTAEQYADKSVQVTGTPGVGGSVSLQGSNDGTNWATLTDPQGNALTFTAVGIKMVAEATRYIRPLVTAGDGTTSLTVRVFMKE